MTATSGWLLAVDPSVRSPGVALFHGGVLRAAARILVKGMASERADRCRGVVRLVKDWHRDVIGMLNVHADTLVTEWPQWYATGKSKGDPNDLAALAGIGAALATAYPAAVVLSPTPAEWIGGLPKSTSGDPWASPRGARIAARLTPAERELVPDQHDALDAVGLGLWALGRFQRRRVLPGAT